MAISNRAPCLNVNVGGSPGFQLNSAIINCSSDGSNTIIAGTAAPIRIYRLLLVPASAVVVTFQDGDTALTGALSLAGNTPLYLPFDSEPHFVCQGAFVLNLGSGVQCSGAVWYY
jgi:hypothetical protein